MKKPHVNITLTVKVPHLNADVNVFYCTAHQTASLASDSKPSKCDKQKADWSKSPSHYEPQLYRHNPACLPICLSICLPVSPSVCLPVSLSAYLLSCLSACLSVCLSSRLCFPAWCLSMNTSSVWYANQTHTSPLKEIYALSVLYPQTFIIRRAHRKNISSILNYYIH